MSLLAEQAGMVLVSSCVPVALAAAIAGTAVGFLEAGFHPNFDLLEIKLERLDPISKLGTDVLAQVRVDERRHVALAGGGGGRRRRVGDGEGVPEARAPVARAARRGGLGDGAGRDERRALVDARARLDRGARLRLVLVAPRAIDQNVSSGAEGRAQATRRQPADPPTAARACARDAEARPAQRREGSHRDRRPTRPTSRSRSATSNTRARRS